MSRLADERHPADALVNVLKGRTVVDASCDGEGVDDVWLLLDDGTTVFIDTELHESENTGAAAELLGTRESRSRLTVRVGSREDWPHGGGEPPEAG